MTSLFGSKRMSEDIPAIPFAEDNYVAMTKSEDQVSRTSTFSSIFSKLSSFQIGEDFIGDATMGFSDGMTVPFALMSGLSSVSSRKTIILAGLGELVPGSLSMGLGGYMAANAELNAYNAKEKECQILMASPPAEVRGIIHDFFSEFACGDKEIDRIADRIMASDVSLKTFLMKHHFGAVKPGNNRSVKAGVTIGGSYCTAALIGLLPYLIIAGNDVHIPLYVSIAVMAMVMFVFGYAKNCLVSGWHGVENVIFGLKGSFEMLFCGSVAVGASIVCVKGISDAYHD